MIYIANYGGISTSQAAAINSFLALSDTPAGQHLAKVAGAFANTPDTGSGGGTPGGLTTELQYNNAGVFGGISRATTDGTTVSFLANGILIKDQTDPTKIAAFDSSAISAATTRTYTFPDATGTITLTSASQSLSNKTLGVTNIITLQDNRFTLQDDGDNTKQMVFQLSGITTGNTRTVTMPDASGTMTLLGNSTTGTGNIVLATSPTLVTPALGVATATSINGLTITTTTGTFTLTNAKTFSVTNTLTLSGTDGSTLNIGAGGTLGSNAYTSTAYAPIASPTFTGVVTMPTPFTLGAISVTSTGTQLNYLSAATGTTGTTSTNLVFSTSPTLVTPTLGAASATSINGLIITTTTGTFTLTNAKTFAVTNSITLSGTDSTVMTFPTTSKTIAANDGSNWTLASQAIGDIAIATSTTAYGRLAAVAVGQVLVSAGTGTAPAYSANPAVTTLELGAGSTDTTLSRAAAGDLAVEGVSVLTTSNAKTVTGKRIQPRTASSTTSSNLSPDLSTANIYYRTTQTATLTIDAPTGTPVIGETIMIYVDSAGAQTLTINATFIPFGAAFPATTTAGKTFMMSAQYNGTNWKTLWANAV